MSYTIKTKKFGSFFGTSIYNLRSVSDLYKWRFGENPDTLEGFFGRYFVSKPFGLTTVMQEFDTEDETININTIFSRIYNGNTI